MNTSRAIQAAFNNAVWCNAVCGAHGGAGRFSGLAWWNERRSPLYYPNLITLDQSAQGETIEPLVQQLLALPSLGNFGVKDSFCRLDLAHLHFAVLFEASWIWLEPDSPRAKQLPLRWGRVNTPPELAAWEAAWWRSVTPEASGQRQTLFPATLLQAPGVNFLAAYREARLVMGCALTQSDGTVGVSCIFSESIDPVAARADLVSEVSSLYPGQPLAGYVLGHELETARCCGFEEVGQLRVWLHEADRNEA